MSKPLRVIVIVVVCLGALAIEAQTKIIRRAYDNFVFDNKNHYLPCEKLLTETQVSRIVEQHQDTIRAIEQVNLGFAGIDSA